jgi:hypothetical protein
VLLYGAVLVCRLAQAIEPGYCEPTYWVGLTAMNMGNTSAGLATLKASLSCRYALLSAAVWVVWGVQQCSKRKQTSNMLVGPVWWSGCRRFSLKVSVNVS